MATSGQIGGLMIAQGMIAAAMEDLGLISPGEMPTAEEATLGVARLNWLLKSLQSRGCNLWRNTQGTETFAASTASVTLSPTVLDVMNCRAVLTGGTERWLTRWERGEYDRIPNKDSEGSPAAFMIDRQRDAVTLTLWPVPSVETEVNYTYARVIEDVTAVTQHVDVPQEWTETIWKLLARALIMPFGVADLSPDTAARITAEADILERRLLDFDRPASIFAGPVRRRYVRS